MVIFENMVISNTNEDEKKDVIVHCTDFFPKDGKILCLFDGEKKGTEIVHYDGVNKNVSSLAHRHTVHFVRNGVVKSTGDGRGSWEQPKYIIIEPFEPHAEQFVALDLNDSFTDGSVELSEKPIMLVRADCYDDIPQEQRERFIIHQYDGDYVKCVNNAFKIFGIKSDMDKIDADGAGHNYSFEMSTEDILDARNLYLNYILDNKWNGKSDISISEEELFLLFDIAKENGYFGINRPYSNPFIKDAEDWYQFYITLMEMGINKEGDNFILKSEEDTLKTLKDFNERKIQNRDQIMDFLDVYLLGGQKEAVNIYKRYLATKEKNLESSDESFSIDEISQMDISELYKFKNHDKAKKLVDSLHDDKLPPTLLFEEAGCKIFYMSGDSYYDLDFLSSKLDIQNANGWIYSTVALNNSTVEKVVEEDNRIHDIFEGAKLIKEVKEKSDIQNNTEIKFL